MVYGSAEDKSDNGKVLPTADGWKKVESVLRGQKTEQAAIRKLGEGIIRGSKEGQICASKRGLGFLHPWDERVAV